MIFAITWASNAIEFFDYDYLREAYAILQSVRPILLIIPWIIQLFVIVCSKKKATLLHDGEHNKNNEDSSIGKSNVNEALREEIHTILL